MIRVEIHISLVQTTDIINQLSIEYISVVQTDQCVSDNIDMSVVECTMLTEVSLHIMQCSELK